MGVTRVLFTWLAAASVAACATAKPTETQEEQYRRECDAGNTTSCESLVVVYLDAQQLERARPVARDICRRGSCGLFHAYFSVDATDEDLAREVCAADTSCYEARLAQFVSWRARSEREAAWEPFLAEATPLCEASVTSSEPDCNGRMYYANYAKYAAACQRRTESLAAARQQLFRDVAKLPHFRGESEVLQESGDSEKLPSFAQRLDGAYACRPAMELSAMPPPTVATADHVKSLRMTCKARASDRVSDRDRDRDCLRLELYDRTKLDPRAPMTPEETAQLEARYQELYAARDQELAASQAASNSEYQRRMAECLARAKAKADAWQARIDALKPHKRKSLNGVRVDPEDPESPIAKVTVRSGMTEGGDRLVVLDQHDQVQYSTTGAKFYRSVDVSPSSYDLLKLYEERCTRAPQR